MRRIYATLLTGCVLLLAAGCSSVNPRAGFDDVRGEMKKRTGRELHWSRNTVEDPEVEKQTAKLLKDKLTVHEAVQVALLNNPRLQATYEELGVAQADLVEAGLMENPVFEGSMRFDHGARPAVDAAVVENFMSIFMIPLRKEMAKQELRKAKLHVTSRAMDLARRVTTEFYRQQAARQSLEMRRTVRDAAEASHEMAQRLREAGNITKLELSQQRRMYEQARLDLSAAELAVAEGQERLNRLMGLWGEDATWQVGTTLPEVPGQKLDVSDLEKKVVRNSLDIAMARRELEARAAQMGITNVTSVLPELEAGVEGEGESSGHLEVGPALSLPIPIFNQGQPARTKARAELRAQWDEYTGTAIDVRAAARAALQRLRVTRQRAEHYRRVVVPLQDRIMHQTQLRYNGMFLGVFQLLQTKQQQVQTRQRYIEELRNYWIARTEMEYLLAGLMVEGSAVNVSAGGGMEAAGGGGH